jgi:hypothetical protein
MQVSTRGGRSPLLAKSAHPVLAGLQLAIEINVEVSDEPAALLNPRTTERVTGC